ncbi:MAG: SOS response-associated peptidase [Firmicutes bacterium]|nr:SOS response-associated peptidase [Bacillota bacterium]
MCGRFTLGVDERELKKFIHQVFDIEQPLSNLTVPRYNIAPGQEILSVINDGKKNRIGPLKWGFVPPFSKDEKSGYKMINAKSETLNERVSFRPSFESKRCVILADGFYEWEKGSSEKQPKRIKMKNSSIFPMAGLWTTFTRLDGSKLHTCTIITCEANSLLGKIHDRMPVILNQDQIKPWLDPFLNDTEFLAQYLKPFDSDDMQMYSVPKLVNSVAYDSIECIKDISES